jgi:hypothetical protein
VLCQECEAGLNAPDNGSYFCSACVKGTFSGRGAAICTLCPPGYITDAESLAQCKVRAASRHAAADTAAAATAQPCSVGKFQNLFGQSACFDCNAGLYQDQSNATGCKPCLEGTVSASNGSDSCALCKHVAEAPDTHLTPIATPGRRHGQVRPFKGPLQLSQLSAGPPVVHERSRPLVPRATYRADRDAPSTRAGLTVCLDCEQGFYQDAEGQGFCKQCDAGRFGMAAAFEGGWWLSVRGDQATLPVCQPCASLAPPASTPPSRVKPSATRAVWANSRTSSARPVARTAISVRQQPGLRWPVALSSRVACQAPTPASPVPARVSHALRASLRRAEVSIAALIGARCAAVA